MTNLLQQLQKEIRSKSNADKAKFLQRFFKTGKGQYAEGDIFLGIVVPESRKIAKKYKNLSIADTVKLLTSKHHEERVIALFILTAHFKKADPLLQKKIVALYLKSTKYINNWDLVDLSAKEILGEYLTNKPKQILTQLAHSKSLWEKRIAMIATHAFIKKNQYSETLKIAKILLKDNHDLIHKAVGWMLREVGNRSLETEEKFLQDHLQKLPRTALRYAIEKFPETKRKKYLYS